MRKLIITILVVLSLPIYLLIYNPSMQLGGLGLILGGIGTVISPLTILALLVYIILQEWKK